MRSKTNKGILLLFLFMIVMPLHSRDTGISGISIERIEAQDKRINLIKTNLDYVWVIISAGFVFFMQAGFMALESGMARSKNSINVAIKNLADFVLGVIGFWLLGFGLMFGKSYHGFFGVSDFMISIENPWTAAFFVFQAVFVGTAATIDSGSVCERVKLKQYILLSFLLSVIIYPIFGHWAWGSFLHGTNPANGGSGWLESLGFKDFAGSSVVHSVGGWMALAGVIVAGARVGKFNKNSSTGKIETANKIKPGDMRFVFLGTFILFFGWFGFNCGSTLSATSAIAPIALNTTLSACFGCLASSILSWGFHPEKKIEGEMIANGVLAGLVGITAGCAYVDTVGAVSIGLVSGIIVYLGSIFIEKVLKLDDVVGAIPVHGFCGVWGTIAVGLFIRPELLGELTRSQQIMIQVIGVLACFGWAFGVGFLFYFLVDKLAGGVRVSREEELIGLNVAEHGATSSILELASTMDALTKSGNFSGDVKVQVETGTEIGDIALLFNKMIDKVKGAITESINQKTIAEKMLRLSEEQKLEILAVQESLKNEKRTSSEKREEYLRKTKDKVTMVVNNIDAVHDQMSHSFQLTNTMFQSYREMESTLRMMLQFLSKAYGHLAEMNTITRDTDKTAAVTRNTIEELLCVTSEINNMVDFINDIANRTHVLSINSSIEASRAGEVGKGFIVIGKEFRELSEQTAKTAEEISRKMRDIELRIDNVGISMNKVLQIVGDLNNLNKILSAIIDENHKLSSEVSERSGKTMESVRMVAGDISEVVDKAGKLSHIGKAVVKELDGVN